MGRAFYIMGPTGIAVAQPNAAAGSPLAAVQQLGLASEPVKVTPQFHYYDVQADDYAGVTPAEVLWMGATCLIDMILIHFDKAILDYCVQQSMASNSAGDQGPAGTPMGITNRLMTLSVVPSTAGTGATSWSFSRAYLADTPMEFPLGSERSLVRLRWRCISPDEISTNPQSAGGIWSQG